MTWIEKVSQLLATGVVATFPPAQDDVPILDELSFGLPLPTGRHERRRLNYGRTLYHACGLPKDEHIIGYYLPENGNQQVYYVVAGIELRPGNMHANWEMTINNNSNGMPRAIIDVPKKHQGHYDDIPHVVKPFRSSNAGIIVTSPDSFFGHLGVVDGYMQLEISSAQLINSEMDPDYYFAHQVIIHHQDFDADVWALRLMQRLSKVPYFFAQMPPDLLRPL